MPFMGEFVLYGLLQDCDYIKVTGFGQQLQLELVNEQMGDYYDIQRTASNFIPEVWIKRVRNLRKVS